VGVGDLEKAPIAESPPDGIQEDVRGNGWIPYRWASMSRYSLSMSLQLRASASQSSYGLFLDSGGDMLMVTLACVAPRTLVCEWDSFADDAKVQLTGVSGPIQKSRAGRV
jgi:hypothetical protein